MTNCLLMKESPMIIALNKEKTVYDGFVTVLEKDLRIRIALPPDYQMKQAKLHCCWQMKRLLHGYQHIVKQRLQHSTNLMCFILELRTVLEMAMKNRPGCQSFSPPHYYSQLITEMEILGWDKLLFVDAEFSTLKLKAEDSAGRQHAIKIKLKSKSTLAHVHSQFLLNVEALSEFWMVLDEIDEQTWVLEPEKATKADSMRRIAIGNNVSIKVQIDPRHPKMLPECCLLGAEHVVTPLRNKLNGNMHLWNPDCSVLQNLKDVLEIEFPSPTTHEKSNFSVECGICYSYRLESAIPDQVCNDPRCGQPFHQVCLYEWLRGLPTSRQSFSIVFGECPYCSKPITVKVITRNP
ncbi:E3 ubiquitin-protein ligase FANCL isoform X3 [Myxocyprinus asiaticus]|uniref:E3 ubiquitin-protein ligase FANCL isoform X3 n=1 Tax=Myxocyprinus asiaticus TaxID=70543 RepID=UPI002222092E|nr:E3 ubiquitin-protein ligase FANCL isoform X3 [Myxocyprinus asiaticus]